MPTMPPRHRPPGMPTREQAEARRKAEIDKRRPSPAERGYDAAWRRCRKKFIEAHPVCCVPGCGKPTSDVDHIKSVRERPDLRLSWSNLRPYCHAHHSQRTATEQGFARRGPRERLA
ncbi:MAG: endonuclease [Rhodospirillales bacterium 24-66-33]|nr:MAG: endonuclease [Rhodospirillales bacterium 35-66-84]OYZ91435.1 MAG: endonuclease [Rhodospirillales bacterium 24-66-33]OZB26265.1 MAG: endonuclease [Rhodospirillales bacterium 39-66-50]